MAKAAQKSDAKLAERLLAGDKRALFLDPGCEQAQQELERLDPKPTTSASPGFFKRIFGKK